MSDITERTISYFCSMIQKCIETTHYISAETLCSTAVLLFPYISSTTISEHFKWIMKIIFNSKLSHLPSPLLKSFSLFFNTLSNKIDTLEYYNKIIKRITTNNNGDNDNDEEILELAMNYNDLIDNFSHFILCCYWNYTFIINLPTIPNDNSNNNNNEGNGDVSNNNIENNNNLQQYKSLITERNFREKFILNTLQNVVKTITPLVSTPDCLSSYINLFKILKCIYQCSMKSIQLFCTHSHYVYKYISFYFILF